MKVFGIAVAAVLGFFVLIGLIWSVSYGVRWVTADPKGRLDAREDILSGQNRIRAYNHFFDLCASVQTAEQQLQASFDELASAESVTPRNEDNIVRIQTNITGVRAIRARAINQYNADAAKSYTDGQFRSMALPYQLDATPFVSGGAITQCAA